MFSRRLILIASILGSSLFSNCVHAADPPLTGVKRVVFLGDSITYSGQYIEFLETVLRLRYPAWDCEFLDLGLPSETTSGLSEPGHAGGAFPRPDLHERLVRVLDQTKPDLIFACYGMNDGIYYPFGEERFAKYRDGIEFVRNESKKRGIKVIHLTPPVFDSLPLKGHTLPAGKEEYRQPYEGYNDTLARYSAWLVSKRKDGWDVVDVHSHQARYLATKRETSPMFVLARDGVHIGPEGHWLITIDLLKHWGEDVSEVGPDWLAKQPNGPKLLELVQSKQHMLKDAWLTQTGHLRPGMAKGIPVAEADKKAATLNDQIKALQSKR